ncbi:MAG: hypothetical protein HW399_1033, partial [Dehalococcoidia bacterium]|nr:hypothetical protein [Dehalococcoidia bacterium]
MYGILRDYLKINLVCKSGKSKFNLTLGPDISGPPP